MKRTKIMGWLVGAAALTFSACSSENDLAEEPTTQTAAQTATKIHVTVGAGISDGEAATRSLVVESEYEEGGQKKTRRTLTFTLPSGTEGQPDYSPGDRLYIWGDITPNERTMSGLLTITNVSDDGTSATFEGDLTVREKVNGSWTVDNEYTHEGDPMTWYGTNTIEGRLIHAATAANAGFYTFGSDGGFRYNHEYSFVTGDGDLVNNMMESAIDVGGFYSKTKGCFELECGDAIFNCTFSGLDHDTKYYVCFRRATNEAGNSQGLTNFIEYGQPVTTDADGTARFAIGIENPSDGYYVIQLCTENDFSSKNVLNCIIGQQSIVANVYNVNRFLSGKAFTKTIDLASVRNSLTVMNGMTLTGELSGDYKISIAPGATVTLSGADIPGRDATDEYTDWAGITCLGDATIVLANGTENSVKGYDGHYPGIQAGPTGTTLTIRGTGQLEAETGQSKEESNATPTGYAAGIGGGQDQTVGNIVIEGGTITARGNWGGSGIGSGHAYSGFAFCGDITITGGKITAAGGNGAAGIGSGYGLGATASCDDITITGGDITATGGFDAAGIGSGYASNDGTSSCGKITINDQATGTASGSGDSPNDIGAGTGGTCREVSVEDGTINDLATCSFTVKYYQYMLEGYGPIPAYNVNASKILVTTGGFTYTVPGTIHDGTHVTLQIRAATGANLTITSPDTGFDSNQYSGTNQQDKRTFSATLSGKDITSGADFGTVDLLMQQ